MEVLKGDNVWRYVTNFYTSPSMADSPDGSNNSKHGKDRYDTLCCSMASSQYKLNSDGVMDLLNKVSQGPEVQLSTAHPSVKHPSVDKSAIFNKEKDTNNAKATRA